MKNAWRTRKLGDVLQVQNGYAFDSEGFNPTKGMPLIRIRSLKPGTETETRFGGDYDKKYVVKAGDLLIGMDGEFGCYEWKGEPALLNQRVCRLQGFSGELVPRFLFYGVNDYLKAIEDVTGYATVKHLSSKQILGIEFPVPPLPEQQRVVGLLDKAFAGIATAKANADKNLQNARALFESHLHSVFSQCGKGWVEKTLEDVCDQITDGKHGDCQDEDGSGYYFLSAKDVKSGTLNYKNARQITRADFEETHRRTNLEPGDILITNSGTIGRIAIAPSNAKTQRTTFQKSVAILKPKRKVIDSTFTFYCLSSGLSRFAKLSAGAAQKNLLLRDLRSYRFALPTILDEQRSVAAKLCSLSSETQLLASLYERKLAALEALKKSLLHQAFTGEL